MRVLLFCLLLLTVSTLIPNCAYESNSRCLSCYYGFDLISGRCDKCTDGFVMMNSICLDQNTYTQSSSTSFQQGAQSVSSSSVGWQNQGSSGIIATSNAQPQTLQASQQRQTIVSGQMPMQEALTQSGSTLSSSSNGLIFDIGNAGVMYLLQLFGVSSRIPTNCETFTQDFKCLKCKSQFTLFDASTCLSLTRPSSSTPSSSGLSSSGNIFSSSISVPNTLSNSSNTGGGFSSFGSSNTKIQNNDLNCQIPSSNGDGTCFQCFYRFFYSSDARKCIQVNDQCATWNKLGECLTCYMGYYVNASTCIVDNRRTVNNQDTNAQASSPTQSLSQSSQANSQISFPQSNQGSISQTALPRNAQNTPIFSNGGGAFIVTSDAHCRLFASNGICFQCYLSYYYNPNLGYCVPVNPQCKSWNNQGHCLSCYVGYTISGTQCVVGGNNLSPNSRNNQPIQSSPVTFQQSSIQNSVLPVIIPTQTNRVSTIGTSNIGASSIGASSIGVSNIGSTTGSSDPNCQQQSPNGVCSQCYSSFYYDATSSKRCITVNPLCRTWNNLGHCLSCYQGYYITSNTCFIESQFQASIMVGTNDLPLTNQDPNCNTYKDRVCIKCAVRTYLDFSNNRCTQVDLNCKAWTQLGVCTTCYDGYFVTNQKECRLFFPEVASVQMKSPLNSDVNCRASDSNGICTQCIFRYVINQSNKMCMKVHDLCRNWSQITALCTGCYGGYSLTSNGQCKVSW